jgi:hypothetical protein
MSFVRTSCPAARTDTDSESYVTRQPSCTAPDPDHANDTYVGALLMDGGRRGAPKFPHVANLVSRDINYPNPSVSARPEGRTLGIRPSNGQVSSSHFVRLTEATMQYDDRPYGNAAVALEVGDESARFCYPQSADTENDFATLQPSNIHGDKVEREKAELESS